MLVGTNRQHAALPLLCPLLHSPATVAAWHWPPLATLARVHITALLNMYKLALRSEGHVHAEAAQLATASCPAIVHQFLISS
jgi:hypothetical protein